MASKKLELGDYKKLLKITQPVDDALAAKIKKKIEQLENPPDRNPSPKTEFICEECEKKFKQVKNHCPSCDSEDIRVNE